MTASPQVPADATTATPGIHLFLRDQPPSVKKAGPNWLARCFKLDVYSPAMLSRKACAEMNISAGLLLLVGFFELTAWTCLFNAVFGGDLLHRGPVLGVALLLAAMVAATVIVFERQILIADWQPHLKRTVWESVYHNGIPILLRVLLILAVAVANLIPLELVFFKRMIDQRTHFESIRKEAADRWGAIDEAYKAKVDSRIYETGITEETARIGQARTEIENLRKEIARNTGIVAGARTQLDRPISDPLTPSEQIPLVRQKAAADSLRVLANERLTEVATKEKDLEKARSKLENDRKVELEKAAQDRSAELERLAKWIEQLARLPMGAMTASEKGRSGDAWTYQRGTYDFFQQWRIVDDLANSREIPWPNASERAVSYLQGNGGLAKKPDDVSPTQINITRLMCLMIGIFIPLMVVLTKSFQSNELKRYYSHSHQAAAGDPDAGFARTVDSLVKDQDDD